MVDNNLPPLREDPTEETVAQNTSTRPNAQLRDDDTEQNVRHKTEILRPAQPVKPRPAQPGAHVQALHGHNRQAPSPGYHPRPRRQKKDVKDSALYLPWWSIVLMLIGVIAVSVGLVVGVMVFRGAGNFLAEPEPVILIVTAQPQTTANNTSLTTSAPSTQIITGQNAPNNLELAGPTLAPVQLSPTPAPIAVGSVVAVEGVDLDMLNVRNIPSLTESSVLFRAEEAEIFNVIEGPEQSDGFTWWRIQDPDDVNRAGWAVSNFLRVQGLP